MNIKQATTELITEEPSKPNMPHQLVRDNFANVLAAHQSICDKVNLPIESYPPYIFRGSERKVSNRLDSDDFGDARQTFGQRVRIAINRFFTRSR